MDFTLLWESRFARHQEIFHIEKVDFWRDLFPGKMGETAGQLAEGESCEEMFEAGTLVPEYSDKNIVEFNSELFHPETDTHAIGTIGRVYPQGSAWKPLNTFPENRAPFTIISQERGRTRADTNHPLSTYPLTIKMQVGHKAQTASQRGGSLNDIADILTSGPGIQSLLPANTDTLFNNYPFARLDTGDDAEFYRQPRMVHHLDATARNHVRQLYGNTLKPGMHILDLMSSWNSHLPENLAECTVEGLGMNEQEMSDNPCLSSYRVHDLNRDPKLPYKDDTFDAVICTVSIEYLCRPLEIIAELHRIIRPGGILTIVVSDRWFPGKEISPWKHLHPFERQGLLLSYLVHQSGYDEISTVSLQGYLRPVDDKYSQQRSWSDPLWAVRGYVLK
jgi:SAM-dependent methyltransferase